MKEQAALGKHRQQIALVRVDEVYIWLTIEAVMMAVPTIPLNCQRMLHGHRALLWHGQKVGDICDDSTVIFTLVVDCLSLQEFLTRARVHYHYLDDAYSDYETTWKCIHYSQRQ